MIKILPATQQAKDKPLALPTARITQSEMVCDAYIHKLRDLLEANEQAPEIAIDVELKNFDEKIADDKRRYLFLSAVQAMPIPSVYIYGFCRDEVEGAAQAQHGKNSVALSLNKFVFV